MDVSIIIQIIGVIAGSIAQVWFENFFNNKISRKEMCKAYLKESDNSVHQNNSISHSFNNSTVHGDFTVNQSNINVKNIHVDRGRDSVTYNGNKNPWVDIIIEFFKIAVILFICLLFCSIMVYTKVHLYLDYWYIFFIVVLSLLTSFTYYSAIKRNHKLYWKFDCLNASLLIMIVFSFLFNTVIKYPETVEALNKDLIANIETFDDVIHISNLIDLSTYNFMDIMCLVVRYGILLLPILLMVLEIYQLQKRNNSKINSIQHVVFLYALMYFFPLFLYSIK